MSNLDWFNESLQVESVSKYLQVQDKNIHYLVWGDESKPGLFFIHGYSAHAHWWDFVAPAFLDNFCAVAIDLSGSGDSEHRELYSQEIFADEIKAVCDDMKWSQADFIAHSMGGSISLNATSIYPEIFKSLTLLDSIVVLPPDKARGFSSSKSMIRADFIYDDKEVAIDSFRLIPPQPCRNDYLLNHIASNSFKERDDGWVLKSDGKIMKTYKSKDLTDILMGIKCPINICLWFNEPNFYTRNFGLHPLCREYSK